MSDFDDGPEGTWDDGTRARIAWYRAGNLGTHDGTIGAPKRFRLDDGRDAHGWLQEALPFPGHAAFRYGCYRSVLTAHWYESHSGGWHGNLCASGGQLYCDNQQGETGIIRLAPEGPCGVFGQGDPGRAYDPEAAMASAPPWAQLHLRELIDEQREREYDADPTAIFWSDGDHLAGAEPFHLLYAYGLQSFQDTIMEDDAWLEHVDDDLGGELPEELAADLIAIARKYASTGEPVRAERAVLKRLFPRKAPGRRSALRALSDRRRGIALLHI